MGDYTEGDYKRVVGEVGTASFLPGTSIEIVGSFKPDTAPEHVVFDFDGTLSLVREGWPEVMVPLMVEVLQETGTDESPDALSALALDFIMKLNGKQTIYQMIRLAEEVKQRGGTPKEPDAYKDMYHDRLMERIRSRREKLASGEVPPEEFLVPGSLQLLAGLRERGARVYLASGTDENFVREEAELLTVAPFFGEHIYGAVADYKSFSKARVIERILESNQVPGDLLLGFGDGYVEIQNIKSVGGTAVAVASDEAGRSGKPDAWKRDRLIGVGADVVIPDFAEHAQVLDYFWGKR
jgi:phosphoglycolate phosphatase